MIFYLFSILRFIGRYKYKISLLIPLKLYSQKVKEQFISFKSLSKLRKSLHKLPIYKGKKTFTKKDIDKQAKNLKKLNQ